MTAKSYKKGSASPPDRQVGALRLYSMRFCPYAKRVRLVLSAKKIPYETVNINLEEKPEWYTNMYPSGKVPMLEGDGILLSESLIISDYLDEAFPGDDLHPADAYEKAKDKMLLEISFTKVTQFMFKLYKTPGINTQEVFKEGELAFAELEKELEKRKATFFGGIKPSMLDLMMWPWFELLIVGYDLFGAESAIVPKDKFPLLNHWMEELENYPAVNELEDKENIRAFLESTVSGKRNFDAGLYDVGL